MVSVVSIRLLALGANSGKQRLENWRASVETLVLKVAVVYVDRFDLLVLEAGS